MLKSWEKTLLAKKGSPAILNSRGQVLRTFRQIEELANSFQTKLKKFNPGSVIAVQIGNHEDWASIFIACLRSKLVVLPLDQSISKRQQDAALRLCRVSGIVAARSRANESDQPKDPSVRWPAGAIEVLPISPPPNMPNWDDKQPALLKLTSGTTAAPRAIRFRSGQLLADGDQICQTMGISNADINFGVIPLSHSYGFSNLLTPLISRGVVMVLSRDRTPRAVLDDIAQTNATVFPGMPVFYQAFCEMNDLPMLPKLRLCISAGAPLAVLVATRFRQRFKLAIHSFYGASECGGICYDRNGTTDVEGFVGTPLEKVGVEILDRSAESSQVGVRSVAAGDGYFPEPDEKKLGNGAFIPDDLLVCNPSGFQIVGRISDVINVAGKKVNPTEVEAELLRFPGIRQAVAFGRESELRSEEVAVCVVAEAGVRESDLLAFCRTTLNASQVPKRIFIVDAIPANERGKINRQALAKRFSNK